MNYFFAVLSATYVFGIFFLADSSLVSLFSVFNPMSLLHIPLYGILTLLLVLALQASQIHHPKLRYILASLVASTVGVLDEFHQSFIPSREASITDILLDVTGVFLALTLFHWLAPFFGRGFSKKGKKVEIDSPP
jgi:VanZ family protein